MKGVGFPHGALRRLVFAVILFWAAAGWGATYGVAKVGSTWRYAAGDYPTGSDAACSADNLQGCLNDLDNGSNTAIIHPGTYTGSDVSATGGLSTGQPNLTVRGPYATDGALYLPGSVIIDATPATTVAALSITQAGWTVSNITLQNQVTSGKYALDVLQPFTCADFTINGCDRAVLLRADATFTRPRIKGITGSYGVYYYSAGITVNWNDFVIDGMLNPTGDMLYINTSSTSNFTNGIITGCLYRAINGAGTASTNNFTNVIFSGNGAAATGTAPVIYTGGANGTWHFTNCLYEDQPYLYAAGSPLPASFIAGGGSITATNSVNASPEWASSKYPGMKTFAMIDDSSNYSYFKSLVQLADSYGYKVGLALSHYGSSAINWPELVGYVNNGHWVGCHAWSAVRALPTMAAFTAAKSSATITVSVTRPDPDDSTTWTGTIQVTGDTPKDLTSTGYDTVTKVVTYLASQGVAIGTATNQIDFTAPDDGTKSVLLASATYDIGTARTLTFDEASFLEVEIKEAKAWLESRMQQYVPGWRAQSYIWPGGYTYPKAEDYALSTVGFLQARSANQARSLLYALDLGRVDCLAIDTQVGSGAQIKTEVTGLLNSMAQAGSVAGLFAHAYDATQWTNVFEAIKANRNGITVDSLDNIGAWIRSQQDHVTGAISYRCPTGTFSCFTDQSDYHLKPTSPAIGAGTPIAWLGSDLAGSAWSTPPSIGVLEYQAPTVAVDHTGGSYRGYVTVSLSCSSPAGCAGVYYTLDGSLPTWPPSGSTRLYTPPLTISRSATLAVLAVDSGGNKSAIDTETYAITMPQLAVNITGSGTVNDMAGSGTGGFSCASSSCNTSYAYGSSVLLHATPSAGYRFDGWSGDCTGAGDCPLTMTADEAANALFSQLHYILAGSTYYATLQDAFSNASGGSTLQAQLMTFTETPVFDRGGASLLLKGGYDPAFNLSDGSTTLAGSLRVKNGTLRIQGVKIQ